MIDHSKTARFQAGMSAEKSLEITKELIQKYADLSGDYNSIHFDEAFAKETIFGRCIAHGGIAASIISNLLGNTLPGPGCVFVKQTVQYRKPLYPGDTATGKVVIQEIMPEKNRILLETVVYNQKNEVALDGTALMIMM